MLWIKEAFIIKEIFIQILDLGSESFIMYLYVLLSIQEDRSRQLGETFDRSARLFFSPRKQHERIQKESPRKSRFEVFAK